MNIYKQFILLLSVACSVAPVSAMKQGDGAPVQAERKYEPSSLGSLTVSQIEYDIKTNILPRQCALLAQTITAKFPMPTAMQDAISTEKAVENLIEIAKVSQENELVRITPVSIEVKNVPTDVVEKLSQGFLEQRTQEILSCLYKRRKCPIFRDSVERVCTEGYNHLPKWLSAVHPTLKKFVEDKCLRKYNKMIESWERMQALVPGTREYGARMYSEHFGN